MNEGLPKIDTSFDFYKRRSYEADLNLTRTRSREYVIGKSVIRHDPWNKPAPDLTMQLYHPQPVPRNSRQAIQPWKYRATFEDNPDSPNSMRSKNTIPSGLQKMILEDSLSQTSDEARSDIIVPPKSLRPYEAKLLFVKQGMLNRDKYGGLKDPDFRGYPSMKSLGQPEFLTNYERDPYNIRFKSNRLNTIRGGLKHGRDISKGKQMGDTPLRQPPKWETELHLPQPNFPTRNHATTRHRPLYRSPHSAFLDRVETKLTTTWEGERSKLQTAQT